MKMHGRLTTLKILGGGIILLCVLFFFFAPYAAWWVAKKFIHRWEQKTGFQIILHNPSIKGFWSFSADSVTVKNHSNIPVLYMEKVETKHPFFSPFSLEKILVAKITVQYYVDSLHCNYCPAIKEGGSSLHRKTTSSHFRKNSFQVIKNMLTDFLHRFPSFVSVEEIAFVIQRYQNALSFSLKGLLIRNDTLSVTFQSPSYNSVWKGHVDFDSNPATVRISSFSPVQTAPLHIPLLDNLIFHYDTTLFLVSMDMEKKPACVRFKTTTKNIKIYHPRISYDTVLIGDILFDATFYVGSRHISTDTSSCIVLNGRQYDYHFSYHHPDKKVYTSLSYKSKDANAFFSSLPTALFPRVSRIRMDGYLDFGMGFSGVIGEWDSTKIFFRCIPSKVKKFSDGSLHIAALKEEFMHKVFTATDSLSFIVGPSNPRYVPLGKISRFLQYAVLTSEDASFYHHKGILNTALSRAFIDNLKKNRFARGGSTITMQLVKNLFLSRKKTISRKLEEMIIVSLIEHLGLLSKERMLEIYFNIIEWGPGVYGIGNASEYYFSKRPEALTINEAIFLAMIIPRPAVYHYYIDENGKLKEITRAYFDLLGKNMLKRNWITPEEHATINPSEVKFSAQVLSKAASRYSAD